MAHWTIYDSEFTTMSLKLIDFGGPDKYINFRGHKVDSYKQQALFQLARSEYLEERLKEANQRILKLEREIDFMAEEAAEENI